MKHILFIVNPVSARGATSRMWSGQRKRLAALGLHFDEHVTTREGEATEVTREALIAGINYIVAVGGDGTLSEVANGYFDGRSTAINPDASIGLLPSGTGSDFHRSLGRPDWIRTLTNDQTRSIDVARAQFTDRHGNRNCRVFVNVASFGLGGEVSALVNRWRNARLDGSGAARDLPRQPLPRFTATKTCRFLFGRMSVSFT